MVGIVDVGGGLRDIYGAGVFDRCLEDGVSFDCCIGVSAGSANIASFLGKQKGRNYRFYHEYPFRREYMSISNIFRCGSFIDLNYIYSVLSNSDCEDPLDYEAFSSYNGKAIVVATDSTTGKARYFENKDFIKDDYSILNASSAIPIVCKPCAIGDTLYYDGGVSDPVPIKKAFDEGCDKVVLVLTKPKSFRKNNGKEGALSKIVKNSRPVLSTALQSSCKKYNDAVELAIKLEKQGKCLIIAPDDCCGVDTLTRNREHLDMLYKKGYQDASAIKNFVKE